MTQAATIEVPQAALDEMASDERVETVRVYLSGWVPNSYRWPAPGTCAFVSRDGTVRTGGYDRKRSGGNGPKWVALSANNGRLASA